MLVLGRRLSESIHFGPGVIITVVRLHSHEVRIGISAPKATRIVRGELLDPETRDEAERKASR